MRRQILHSGGRGPDARTVERHPGNDLNALFTHPSYPNSPSLTTYIPTFESPVNTAENFGARIRGYVVPPVTGSTPSGWPATTNRCSG
jgi:hypothetical protein